jgi:transposase
MPLTRIMKISSRDRKVLTSWCRSTSIPAGLAQRARIVLLAADGAGTNEIVARTGASKPTVIGWKRRYAAEGLAGLDDRPRSGRPRTTDDVDIVLATLEPPPERLGAKRWSSRLLARSLGISNVKVAKVWREYGLRPWRREAIKFAIDPPLATNVRDVMGLYLSPPDKAIVISLDDQSAHGASVAAEPMSLVPLSAALEVAAGPVRQARERPRHRNREFLNFLKKVARAHPGTELHVLVDNDTAHQQPGVRRWLARRANQRITLHVAPTQSLWLNLAEILVSIMSRRTAHGPLRAGADAVGAVIRREDLIKAIAAFIDGWHERCQPFAWSRSDGDLLGALALG